MTDTLDSILLTTKKLLGMDAEFHDFDTDIIVAINTAIMTLQQLKVGDENGFMITGPDETWSQFLGNVDAIKLQGVKTYVYLRCRLIFDPPEASYVLSAFQDQAKELEWRLNVQVDRQPVSPIVVERTYDVFADTDTN